MLSIAGCTACFWNNRFSIWLILSSPWNTICSKRAKEERCDATIASFKFPFSFSKSSLLWILNHLKITKMRLFDTFPKWVTRVFRSKTQILKCISWIVGQECVYFCHFLNTFSSMVCLLQCNRLHWINLLFPSFGAIILDYIVNLTLGQFSVWNRVIFQRNMFKSNSVML